MSANNGKGSQVNHAKGVAKTLDKEAKQHFGWLQEQSNHYGAYVASIHLAAIRFCLLMIARQQHDFHRLSDIRQAIRPPH